MPDKKPAGYAVVDFAGKQFRVTAGQELKVPHTDGEAGSSVQLERVLLLNDGGATRFGSPTVAGVSVDATLLRHGRDKKIMVFKFRRRKGYRKKMGHRQGYSILRINGFSLAETKSPAKTTAKVEAAPEPVTKTRKTTATRKTAAKSAAGKKTTGVAKQSAPKKATTAKKSAGKGKSPASKTAVKKKAASS